LSRSTHASTDAPPAAPAGDGRPRRADAHRNRERILDAATQAFAAAGTVPLESIARDAGVGIGTLYRHFPTREALVEAVYAAELDAVVASASALPDSTLADAALRAWMDRYAQFVATKRGMIDTLRAGWSSGRIATPTTRERITAAIAELLAVGERDGSLRADIRPNDVTAMLLGVFLSTAGSGASEQTGRLLDLTVDALRSRRDG